MYISSNGILSIGFAFSSRRLQKIETVSASGRNVKRPIKNGLALEPNEQPFDEFNEWMKTV